MANLNERLASLSPEQRELLLSKLKKAKPAASQVKDIPQRSNPDYRPLSYGQKGFWFLEQLNQGSSVNNIPSALKFDGRLNITALEESLNQIIARHEILQVHFETHNGQPLQIPQADIKLTIHLIDLTSLTAKEQQDKAQEMISEEALLPFNLEQAPLLRAKLLRLNERRHILLLTLHHIIADAWSVGIFVQEIIMRYTALVKRTPLAIAELPIQYFDFAAWQENFLKSDRVQKQLAFWRDTLQDLPSALELPTDFPRPPVQTHHGAHIPFKLSSALSQKIIELSKKNSVTLFMTLLAVYHVFLYRYSGQSDFGIGAPLANRHYKGSENLIGLFINTVVMRPRLEVSQSFEEFLKNIKSFSLDAFSNNDVPFEMIVKELNPQRELSHNPLFQVLFDFRNTPRPALEFPDLQIDIIEQESGTVKFDLVLSMEQTSDGLNGIFGFNTDLFKRETIQKLIGYFTTLVENIVENPAQPISGLRLLTPKEEQRILYEWNNTSRPLTEYAKQCVHHLFEQQAQKNADKPAIIYQPQLNTNEAAEILTYAQLNRRANQLAHYLLNKGLQPEDLVILSMERSPEMVIALLAVLKAGGAYIPVDPDYPEERIALILDDSQARFILTQKRFDTIFSKAKAEIVLADDKEAEFNNQEENNPTAPMAPYSLAYLIYTSGSTGTPKAVLVRHESLLNHALATMDAYQPNASDRMLQFFSLSFDAAGEEIYPALLSGIPLVLPPKGSLITPYDISQIVKNQQISILHLPVVLWQNWVDFLEERALTIPESLRIMVVGGEAPALKKVAQMRAHAKRPLSFINAYGPTEATITSCYYQINPEDKLDFPAGKIPIGRPMQNMRMYILDANRQPVPPGVKGEIYIGGQGVARGYLNRPELTAEKFIPDPFSDKENARFYRTGDLAHYLEDGNIVFDGRADHQLKLRGFRIEIGEIEALLNKHNKISRAAVVAAENEHGVKFLCAYVLAESQSEPSEEELRAYLAGLLPEYMLPAVYIFPDSFPLTTTGKVNRKALSASAVASGPGAAEYQPPQTKLQKFIYQMWKDILGMERIGIHDNFFALGGSSIQGATFVNRLQDALGEYVYIVALYDAPTIAELCELLKRDYPQSVFKITGEKVQQQFEQTRIRTDDIEHFRRIIWSPGPAKDEAAQQKNTQAVFVISSPRSGSTLTRAILGGSPKLFSPPELQLLNYDTLQQRKKHLTGRDDFWLDGTVRAIMAIKDCSVDEAWQIMEEYEAQNMSVKDFYRVMQEWIGDRVFVDKTPNYALSPDILQRAEAYFDNALYVHLIRHPYGVIPSFQKAKLHVFYPPFFTAEHNFSSRQLAELVWLISHQNILKFLENIPAERRYRLFYEDLVQEPQKTVQGVCDFLHIDIHPDMLEPQKNKEKRMTDGLNDLSKMLGDVRFHEHKGITADRAYHWKKSLKEDYLSDSAWELVEAFGYENRTEIRRLLDRSIRHISRLPADAPKPLSFSQQRLWFLDQLEPDSPFYNMPVAVRIKGALDKTILEKSINTIIQRHEILRASFTTIEGRPQVQIADNVALPIVFSVLSDADEQTALQKAENLVGKEAATPFNLDQAPLLRCRLLQIAPDDHVFVLNMHHIISDGVSLSIFIKELAVLYQAFLHKQPNPLPELPVQYFDFAQWQRSFLDGEKLNQQLDYWKETLSGAPPLIQLPTDRPRPRVQTFHGSREYFEIPAEISAALKKFSLDQKSTLFTTLLTAFKIFLSRYSRQEDIVVGIPVAGRNRSETEALIGFFVNTLVLRSDLSGAPGFTEAMTRVQEVVQQAYAHQDVPFEKIVDVLNLERNLSYTPIFQVMFAFQEAPQKSYEMEGISISPLEMDSGSAKFDMTLSVVEDRSTIRAMWEYNTDLFDAATISAFIEHFQNLLKAISEQPAQKITRLALLSKQEERRLLHELNHSVSGKSAAGCFHLLFQEQAAAAPERTAVVWEGTQLSYAQLNRKANQLAHYLRQRGAEPETFVGIHLDRSLEMIISILAVLKSGAAYVPLDPNYPKERLAFIVEDAGLQTIISTKKSELPQDQAQVIYIDAEQEAISRQSEQNPANSAVPQNSAYVIYTSGSTGKPKGVVIQHQSMLHLLDGLYEEIYNRLDEQPLRASLNAPILFDASVQQLVLLLKGHTLYPIPQDARLSGDLLLSFIRQNKLDVLDCVPSQLKLLLAEGMFEDGQWQPQICLPGGEAIDGDVWRQLQSAGQTQFYNVYGPTECTVDSTIFHINGYDGPPNIGRPIRNAQVYILDADMQLAPQGIPGEIFISGDGLSRGYLNRPGLTAERFLPHPFSEKGGERLYRSGDLGRFLPDGNIEFLGRVDHQVKVRGFRIELGEIEAVLAELDTVKNVVTVVREDTPGVQRIVAYLTASTEDTPSDNVLRAHCKPKLPDYMIPSVFVWLKEIPLTPNGKIDRKALPEPDAYRPNLETEFVAPSTENEKILADILCQLLGLERVGIRDNFFELGGDSILIIQVIARAKQAGLSITPKQIFENPTVEGLAAVAVKGQAVQAEQGIVTGEATLTPIQRRFFELDFSNPHHWNQSLMLETDHPLKADILKQVVAKLLEHHDALRLRVKKSDSGTQLYIEEKEAVTPFTFFDLSDRHPEAQRKAIARESEKLQAALDLNEGPIMRVAYFSLGGQAADRLLIIIHHLAIDGVSWRILTEDIQLLYNQLTEGKKAQLPPKSTSFRYWAQQLAEYGKKQISQEEMAFWRDLSDKDFSGLPVDFKHGPNDEASVLFVEEKLERTLTKQLLKEIPPRFNAQFTDVLLTNLLRVFGRWTGRHKLWLELEGHGRENLFDHVDLSRTVGWFTTLYPVHLDISGLADPLQALQSVKQQMRRIPQNGIGFGLLKYFAENPEIKNKLAGIPHADIIFNYLGQFETNHSTSGAFRPITDVRMIEHSPRALRSNLWDISVSVVDGVLKMRIAFSGNFFKEETVGQFLKNYIDELKHFAAYCSNIKENVYTAADFSEAGLEDAELDDLLSELDED